MNSNKKLDDYITFDDLKDDYTHKYEFSGLHSSDTITISSPTHSYGAAPNVTIGDGSYGSNTYPYTVGTGLGGAGTGFSNPWATTSSKIKLDGEGADIEVNGRSLMDMIERIEQRLNILTPNTELEAEWEELRTLGNRYRELEKHIQEKQATWDRLKAMPPPVID